MGWKEDRAYKKMLKEQRKRQVEQLGKEIPGTEGYERTLNQIKATDDLIKGGKLSKADGWRIALSAIGILGLPALEHAGVLMKSNTDRQAIGLLKDILPKPGRKDLDADQINNRGPQSQRPPKR